MSEAPERAPVTRGEPVLRLMPGPRDINSNGHIFGGWVLSQMDIAGGIVAANVADGPVTTVAVDGMEFVAPILLQDVIAVYARVERIGRTSVAIAMEVCAVRDRGTREVLVTNALYTYVALDDDKRPRQIARD